MNYLVNKVISDIDYKIWDSLDFEKVREVLYNYLQNLNNKLNKTKNIIFRNEPINFKDNYIPLTISNRINNYRVEDVSVILKKYRNIGIIGNAGSGKSTFLKHVALSCINSSYKIPILIELRNMSYYDFEQFVSMQLDNENSNDILKLFTTGNFVFLLDGFDEIDYNTNKELISSIEAFMTKYSANDFLITSRPGTNIESINNLYIFNINPLNKNEIFLFIDKINANSNVKHDIYDNILDNEFLGDILSIPLFLSLYISTYNSNNNLVISKKTIFFRNIIESLFTNHDNISKLGYVREKISNLTKDELERIISILAFRMIVQNKFQVSKDEIYQELELIKRTSEFKFENEKVLFDLLITINILVELDNHYSFPHILIQEYLCAVFISRLDFYEKDSLFNKILINKKFQFSYSLMEFIFELDKYNFTKAYIIPFLENYLKDEIFIYSDVNNGTIQFIEQYYFDKDSYNFNLERLYTKLKKEYNSNDDNNYGGLLDF